MTAKQIAQLRHITLTGLGFGSLVYALIPPIKPEYVAVAGGLLGLSPVIQAAAPPAE